MDNIKKDEAQDQKHDELAESLNDLFSSVTTMIKSELQVKPLTLSVNALRFEIAPLFRKSTVISIDLFCYNLR
jgi:hypothetical protein